MSEAGPPVSAHDDQVTLAFLSNLEDASGWISIEQQP
jgi:hypothetical protein